MISGMSVLALIPARGGSKGLPGKNIRPVEGRPLLDFTVAAARNSRCVDRVVLSTDDDDIAQVGLAAGCEVPFRRPPELSTDEARTMDVVLHALDNLPRHDLVVLLQPTSPMRSADDIDAACSALVEKAAPACVSVTEAEESPWWMYRLAVDQRLEPLIAASAGATRRQDLPVVYSLNGAVYVARTDWLRETRNFVTTETIAHVMPRERSIDIDTLEDFETFSRNVSRGKQ